MLFFLSDLQRRFPFIISIVYSQETKKDYSEAFKLVEGYDEERLQIMANQALKAGKPMPKEVEYINRALGILNLDLITGQ